MKKNLMYLAILVITGCLIGFAFDRIIPAGTVHASSEAHTISSSAGPLEKEALPPTGSTQPVVYVAIGLVCVLFGIIAVFPLLIGDPAQALQEVNRAGK